MADKRALALVDAAQPYTIAEAGAYLLMLAVRKRHRIRA
jgi:hypothetical protein